ncbi:Mbov_0399 family ICE element protein [Mesomycoplasma neurolyticum]|uniref:Uncharacterized protein n=1 Tax=Mesomycoplasma neurolyticum TaxID=2120 RepID=A0A449A4L0_9BACT|nr:hypothetical protein [Mesomycoplasma neurolyticum]VEU59220.1 Uncharacterised protein [Mesomycoplasma neurolyticum]
MKNNSFLFKIINKFNIWFFLFLSIFSFISYKSINEKSEIVYKQDIIINNKKSFETKEWDVGEILNYDEKNRKFSSENSQKFPFTILDDGISQNKKEALHQYWHTSGNVYGFINWYNYLTDNWYGANINIANGLEGWYNNKKQQYLGSNNKPEGLNYDDGYFAIQKTTNSINLLDESINKLKFYFGLEKNNLDASETQFSKYGKYGKDLSNFIFEELFNWRKNEINKFKQEQHKLKEFYLKNLEIQFNFYIKTNNKNYYDFYPFELDTKITKIRAKLSFDYHIKYDEFQPKKYNLLKNIKKFQDIFLEKIIKNNEISIYSDLGSDFNLAPMDINNSYGYKNNVTYLDEKLNNFLIENKKIINDDFNLKYKIQNIDKIDKLDFYIEYYDIITNSNQWIKINDSPITIKYIKTEKFKNLDIYKRLLIIPGFFLDQKKLDSLDLQKDIPIRMENDRDIGYDYGGTWIYNAPVKIAFQSTFKEDEILLINNKKIDVLNQNFFIDIGFNDENNLKNEYKIELVKFKKNLKTNENKEIFRWTKIIKILKDELNLNIKWFAWDPENNREQRKLIEPFVIIKNEELLDKNGEKIPNPDFDPNIDKNNGTKSEIVWINFLKDNDLLPNNTRFLQDPIDENENLNYIAFNKKIGFIAEAYVIKKGINLSINNKYESFKIFKIAKNNEQFELISDETLELTKKGKEANFIFNDNEYFSHEGLWLFSYRTKNSLNKYKLVYITKEDNKKNFNNFFPNNDIINLWESIPGKHLSNYLNEKFKINETFLKQLTYDEIINYWKMYVSNTTTSIPNNYINFNIISPKIDLQKSNNFTSKINFDDFNPNEEEKNEFLSDFKWKEKIKFKIEINEHFSNVLKFTFDLKDNVFNSQYKINKPVHLINVIWKKDRLQKYENINKNEKKEIIPKFNDEKIIDIISKSKNKQQFLNLINEKIFSFLNFEKTTYKTIFLENNIIFNFSVIPDFYNSFYIKPESQILILEIPYYLNNELNKKINIFENFQFNVLDLKGLIDKNKIKNQIQKFLKENIQKEFVYNEDYEIENFDEKVEEISNLTKKPNSWIILKLKTKNNSPKNINGSKILKIFNTYKSKISIDKIIDLSLIKIPDLVIDSEETTESITLLIEKHILSNLKSFNLNLQNEISVIDYFNKIKVLFSNKNKWIVFEIIGNFQNFINKITFKIMYKNNGENALFDLSNLNLEINLECENFNCAYKEILKQITKYLDGFSLKKDYDYVVEKIDDQNYLKLIIDRVGENVLKLKINSINNKKTLNHFYVIVKNIIKNQDIETIKKNWLIEQRKISANNFNFLWLIPVIFFAFIILIILILKIYNLYFRYK